MKMLITGMNTNQCTEDFFLRQQLKVVPSHYSLLRSLRDMGHEVEQRVVTIGEDLAKYDEVFVFIHNPSGFAGYVYNALYAISQRPNCILLMDDWQTDSIYEGLLALQEGDHKLFRKYVVEGHANIPEDFMKYADFYRDALAIIQSKTNRMLLSAFAGGDLSKLITYPSDKLYSYNPNPYHLNRQADVAVSPQDKRREMSFASLVQGKTKKWLKAQKVPNDFEIKFYGSRKDGQDRLTEDQMVNTYAQQWVALMPGYFHAGSGWWRARPLQCADVGTIVIGDFDEMMNLYGDEALASLKASDLEGRDHIELAAIAKAQRDALYAKHPLDKQTQRNELDKVLNGQR